MPRLLEYSIRAEIRKGPIVVSSHLYLILHMVPPDAKREMVGAPAQRKLGYANDLSGLHGTTKQ